MIFRPAILYVDDEPSNLSVFERAFGSEYLVKTCLSAFDALKVLEKEDFPLVIVDQKMPGMTGIELCERLITLRPHSLRMILTAYTETQLLLEAIHRGHVQDYIVKPWKKSKLKPILDKAFADYKEKVLKLKELEARADQARHLEKEIERIYNLPLIGASTGLKGVFEMIKRVAPTDATVLITGETGTGKELIARALHAGSHRRQKPFVAVHCASLAPSILESELFGHERGSFTGAEATRIGRFEAAQDGTLFLDEVGEIPEAIQIKLLRVLQEKEIQRVGSNKNLPVDVRLVAATHRNLRKDVAEGRFREDLYFRLNVIPLELSPLRERKEDIRPLAEHFLKKFNRHTGRSLTFDPRVFKEMESYDWPGNVRELQNSLERAVILSAGPQIEPEDLHLHTEEILSVEKVEIQDPPRMLRQQIQTEEMNNLHQVLRQAGGNIAEAARLMGVARSTLFYRLKRLGLI